MLDIVKKGFTEKCAQIVENCYISCLNFIKNQIIIKKEILDQSRLFSSMRVEMVAYEILNSIQFNSIQFIVRLETYSGDNGY